MLFRKAVARAIHRAAAQMWQDNDFGQGSITGHGQSRRDRSAVAGGIAG